ncbi:MAG: hypothetical protein CMD81_14300 [Gammaproteobacteria bacterium]|nr:hypothetical protein [Gammaproteobacteria bacterium]HBF09485.1 hypothetical protein [Gammaproteobacteria bacterium]|tara:strand:+ start:75 stop:824 length:750 start_codon:yes stop_codon:yes gene_type:complete
MQAKRNLNKGIKKLFFAVASTGIGLLSVQSFAATELTYKENKGQEYKVYLSESRVGSHEGFYDLTKDNFVMIHHGDKTYSVVARKDIANLLQRSQQMMSQLEGLGAYLPPEYQDSLNVKNKKAEQVKEFNLQKNGSSRVANYKCENFTVTKNNTVKGKACVANPSDLNLPNKDLAGLSSAVKNIQTLVGKIPGLSNSQQQQLLLFKEGIPLKLSTDRGDSWVLTAVKASEQGLHVPKGYSYKQFSLLNF